jgi:nuclear GTP-binding protein
MKEFK